jgi:AcrR family transcriptional regulator
LIAQCCAAKIGDAAEAVNIDRTAMSDEVRKRPYRLKRRAETLEETRRRITVAAMELHGSIGPARTSISAVAERAGVQRGTVYRHFPDEVALFAACSAHWERLHPPPDPARWVAIPSPDERLRTALGELYAWYREGEPMLANVVRDAPHVPALRQQVEGMRAFLAQAERLLLAGRSVRGRRRARVAAALGHALQFETWHSLAGRGLADDEIVALIDALVTAAR